MFLQLQERGFLVNLKLKLYLVCICLVALPAGKEINKCMLKSDLSNDDIVGNSSFMIFCAFQNCII